MRGNLNTAGCWPGKAGSDMFVLQTKRPVQNCTGRTSECRRLACRVSNWAEFLDLKPAAMEALQWLRPLLTFHLHCRIRHVDDFQVATARAAATVPGGYRHGFSIQST